MSALDALAGITFLQLLLGGSQQQPGSLPPLPYVPPTPSGPLVQPPSTGPLVTPAVAPSWPAVVPSDLPPFPGDQWEPDTPVPTPVVQRAVALLPQLWAQGEGTHQPEMTAGHWVMYLAQMLNGKHGVTAWRVKKSAVAPSPSTPAFTLRKPAAVPSSPLVTPAVYKPPPQPAQPTAENIVPAPAPAPTVQPDALHALALQLRDALNANGYRKRDQALYRQWESATGHKPDGYPGTDDMATLKHALDELGQPMPNVPIYPWKAAGGWKHPNAPTLAEWNR